MNPPRIRVAAPESAWRFGFVAQDRDDKVTFEIGEAVGDQVRERVFSASQVIDEWIVDSPFIHFEQSQVTVDRLVQTAASVRGMSELHTFQRDIQTSISDWLSRFRAFDDHTSRLVARHYTKNSAEFRAFKASLSLEYDLNPCYRFSWRLRNYTQHVGRPVQILEWSAWEGMEEDGSDAERLVLEFDPNALLRDFDGWGATVKGDLERTKGSFPVLGVLRSTYKSAERVFASLVLSEAPRIQAAIDEIDRYPLRADGGQPAFFQIDVGEFAAKKGGPLQVYPVPFDLARRAEGSLQKAAQLLYEPHHTQPTP